MADETVECDAMELESDVVPEVVLEPVELLSEPSLSLSLE